MKNLILIILMFFFSGCNDYNFNITDLKQEKLKFLDLPIAVKEFLIQPPNFDNENPSSLVIINSKESNRYLLEVVNTWVGPWIDYMKLVDTENKISYRINQGVPNPFFVYDNRLYIPDRFNVFSVINDLNKVEFTCYKLK
jgi:hypothetical protein